MQLVYDQNLCLLLWTICFVENTLSKMHTHLLTTIQGHSILTKNKTTTHIYSFYSYNSLKCYHKYLVLFLNCSCFRTRLWWLQYTPLLDNLLTTAHQSLKAPIGRRLHRWEACDILGEKLRSSENSHIIMMVLLLNCIQDVKLVKTWFTASVAPSIGFLYSR